MKIKQSPRQQSQKTGKTNKRSNISSDHRCKFIPKLPGYIKLMQSVLVSMTEKQGSYGCIPESIFRVVHHVRICVCSHGAALVLVCMRVFETESLFGSIFLQVGELLAVDGSPALLSDELNGIFVLHPTLYQSQGH